MNAPPLRHLNPADYALAEVGRLSTPRLLVYRERVEENVARMRGYLEAAAPGSGFRPRQVSDSARSLAESASPCPSFRSVPF